MALEACRDELDVLLMEDREGQDGERDKGSPPDDNTDEVTTTLMYRYPLNDAHQCTRPS